MSLMNDGFIIFRRVCRDGQVAIALLALLLHAAFLSVAALAQAAPIPRIPSTPARELISLRLPSPRLSVIVFADHPMSPAQWTALFSAMRAELGEEDKETQALDRYAEFIEGDRMPLGLSVDSSITVYLHGDCNLTPLPRRTAYGVPLGWVLRVDGRVEPFAHVDCTHIGQVIGPQAKWLSDQRRVDIMAGAMARVILHEWIHIATQNRNHTESGIAKAEFGVADLIGTNLLGKARPDEAPRSRPSGGR
jgi:hypothetical protein